MFCRVLQLLSRPLPEYKTQAKGKQTGLLSSILSYVVGLGDLCVGISGN